MSDYYLGFDFGKKRIGVAIGQDITSTARPLTQIATDDQNALVDVMNEWQPKALIVGLPLNMDDTAGPLAKAAKKFAKRLENVFERPVHLCDERLTSREAIERLKLQGKNKPTKAEINSMAAAVILETWLLS